MLTPEQRIALFVFIAAAVTKLTVSCLAARRKQINKPPEGHSMGFWQGMIGEIEHISNEG